LHTLWEPFAPPSRADNHAKSLRRHLLAGQRAENGKTSYGVATSAFPLS